MVINFDTSALSRRNSKTGNVYAINFALKGNDVWFTSNGQKRELYVNGKQCRKYVY